MTQAGGQQGGVNKSLNNLTSITTKSSRKQRTLSSIISYHNKIWWLTWCPFPHRRLAYLSPSGAGCPLLCRDQISKIRWGPPSVDHWDCRERKPYCSHHWQTTDHRGGATSSHAECQPNPWCNVLILLLCCIIDRKTKAPLSDFRHINCQTILACWNIYTK